MTRTTSSVHLYFFLFQVQTTLTEIPEDINMTDWKVDVMFPCKALSDPSTPITLKWYFDDVEIHPNTEG